MNMIEKFAVVTMLLSFAFFALCLYLRYRDNQYTT